MLPWGGKAPTKAAACGIQFTLAALDLSYRGKLKASQGHPYTVRNLN
jgi:hypothetical protein